MIEKLSSVLPKNLPTPNDRRTSIYELYDQFGSLRDFGYTTIPLFRQYVRNINGDVVSGLVYAFASQKKPVEEAVWVVAGVHGYKEQASPMAVAQEIELLGKMGKEFPMVVIGLLNLGYVNNSRYAINEFNEPTFNSLCDFDHLVLDSRLKKRIRTRRDAPSSNYAKDLGKKFLELLNIYPAIMLLDLHEDWTNTATHIYSDGILGFDDFVAKEVVEIFRKAKVPLLMETDPKSIERTFETTHGGICVLDNGSLENFVASPFVADPSNSRRIIWGPSVPVCITTETLVKHNGKVFDITERVETQAQVLREIPRFVGLIHKHKPLYDERLEIKKESMRKRISASGLLLV